MPELPEVEHFRQLLLPLVSPYHKLSLELVSEKTPRTFLSEADLDALKDNCHVADVFRKGKLICMVLDCIQKVRDQRRVYLFIHMGMTGRISTPQHVPTLESLKETSEYPPSHTCLRFHTSEAEACFSDPRRFGSVKLGLSLEEGFDKLAPDALTCTNMDGLVYQSLGIKGILLDQGRVVSGVGNWVADEVLYQCQLHPEQKYLTTAQAEQVGTRLRLILQTAISCLEQNQQFPNDWLFHCRWKKRSATNGSKVKDPQGGMVVFVTAAGRTSAIVPSTQRLKSQITKAKQKSTNQPKKRNGSADKPSGPDRKKEAPQSKRKRTTPDDKVVSTEGLPTSRSKRKSK